MKYTCSTCGKEHDDWPAIAFDAPDYYYELSEEDKKNTAEKSNDFCVIQDEEQTDRFVRAVLFQKVNEHCDDLNYGVWVSLSKKSFNDYKENFNNEEHEAVYFGYLSNTIYNYDDTLSIHTNVVVSKGSNRSEVIPHKSDHPFVQDYYNGISIEEAERRIAKVPDKIK